jgi:hypothetical protein
MNEADLELLQGLPPEVLQQLMGMGGIPDQMGLEQQRMAMGSQLGQPTSGNHTTAQGAALGGIGDILRGVGGGLMQGQGIVNQQKLLKDQTAGRNQYATSIQDFLRKRRQQPGAPMATSDAGLLEPLGG